MTKSSGVILNAAGGGPEGMSPMDGRNNLAPVLPDTSALDAPPALLPYQQRWVADTSPLKVIEKSRRTGITWAEASDNVLTAASSAPAGGMNVYYIAYNQDMTVEYIQACAMWARAFNYAASEIEEGFWEEDDDDKHIRTYTIKFPDSGFRIVALSSRPSNLRGRQGIIVIDEAAFHEQLDELLKAALAMLIWGERYALSPPMTVTTIRSIRLSGISVPDVREAAYIASLSGKPYLRGCSGASVCAPGRNGRRHPSRPGWRRCTNSTVPVHPKSLTVFRPTVAVPGCPVP